MYTKSFSFLGLVVGSSGCSGSSGSGPNNLLVCLCNGWLGVGMGKRKKGSAVVAERVHPSVPGMPNVVIHRTTHVEIVISGPRPSREEVGKLILEKALSLEDSLEFYEALAEDIRELYGTDDPEELKKLALREDDLWLEEHVRDLEIYHALKDGRTVEL